MEAYSSYMEPVAYVEGLSSISFVNVLIKRYVVFIQITNVHSLVASGYGLLPNN